MFPLKGSAFWQYLVEIHAAFLHLLHYIPKKSFNIHEIASTPLTTVSESYVCADFLLKQWKVLLNDI